MRDQVEGDQIAGDQVAGDRVVGDQVAIASEEGTGCTGLTAEC